MSLLAHITGSEVAFIMAVFLFGLGSGWTLGWRFRDRQVEAARREP